MHNPASIIENDTHKLLWDVDIQTDRLISTRPYSFNNKKRACRIVDFAVPGDQRAVMLIVIGAFGIFT